MQPRPECMGVMNKIYQKQVWIQEFWKGGFQVNCTHNHTQTTSILGGKIGIMILVHKKWSLHASNPLNPFSGSSPGKHHFLYVSLLGKKVLDTHVPKQITQASMNWGIATHSLFSVLLFSLFVFYHLTSCITKNILNGMVLCYYWPI